MIGNGSRIRMFGAWAVVLTLFLVVGCSNRAAIEETRTQVNRITEQLDARTTETGVYIRAEEGEIRERDSWGTPLQVTYSQGGMAETVSVRSAGPDREFHTPDDIVDQGMAVNLKGVGQGIKEHAEETAANTARGVVRGTVEGVRDSIRESWPRKKQNDDTQSEADGGEQASGSSSDGTEDH